MLLHDTWGRSTNKRRQNKRAVSPLHDTHQAVHFLKFFYFRGGRRNRRKQLEEDNERAVPQHNTWRRSTNIRWDHKQGTELCPPSQHIDILIVFSCFRGRKMSMCCEGGHSSFPCLWSHLMFVLLLHVLCWGTALSLSSSSCFLLFLLPPLK